MSTKKTGTYCYTGDKYRHHKVDKNCMRRQFSPRLYYLYNQVQDLPFTPHFVLYIYLPWDSRRNLYLKKKGSEPVSV